MDQQALALFVLPDDFWLAIFHLSGRSYYELLSLLVTHCYLVYLSCGLLCWRSSFSAFIGRRLNHISVMKDKDLTVCGQGHISFKQRE
jgi:hypothetical protein